MPATTPISRAVATFALACTAHGVLAQQVDADAARYVQFVQDNAAMCVSRNAVEILVKSTHPSRTVRVWLDRYTAGVPTADRSRTELKPRAEPEPLGCSRTPEGATQEWRIVRVQFSD